MRLTADQIQIVKAARDCITQHQNRERLAEKTCDDYRKTSRRLFRDLPNKPKAAAARAWENAAQTRSKNTWFKRKAALIFFAQEGLRRTLSRQDQIQRALRRQPTAELTQEFDRALLGLEFYTHLLQEIPDKPQTPQRRISKRQHIQGLPPDWALRVAVDCPDYQQAILVQAATGCRPAELVSGVVAEIDGDLLVCTVKGAKVTAAAGQPMRTMTFQLGQNSSPILRVLAQAVAVAGGKKTIQIQNPKYYSKAFERAAANAFPGRRKSLTPYCLRHQFSAALKAEGHTPEEIAAALGHAATKSQSFYGTAGQGSGGTGLLVIEASRPVRRVSKPMPDQSDGPRP